MKKIQLSPDATSGGTPSKETQQQIIDRLTAEIERLTVERSELKAEVEKCQAKLAKYESADAQRAEDEKLIIEKMTHGLSRPQAINVIERQRNFDGAKEKSDKSKVPGTKSKAK